MSIVEHVVKIYKNCIEISPTESVEDNCIYEITLSGIYPKNCRGKIPVLQKKIEVYTALKPSYSSIEAVNSLVGIYSLHPKTLLYFIRESSRQAEYIKGCSFDENNIPFEISQYVKYRAAYESLLKAYIDRTSKSGQKGTLSEISFENAAQAPDIKELLNRMREQAEEWEEQLRGMSPTKRTKPVSAVKGSGRYNTSFTDYSRGLG